MENFRSSTFCVEDGSYIRLKDISLSYTLPENICKKLKMKQFDISINASNLLTWTNYSGYDPEVDVQSGLTPSMDYNRYPRNRQFSVGVNVTF